MDGTNGGVLEAGKKESLTGAHQSQTAVAARQSLIIRSMEHSVSQGLGNSNCQDVWKTVVQEVDWSKHVSGTLHLRMYIGSSRKPTSRARGESVG